MKARGEDWRDRCAPQAGGRAWDEEAPVPMQCPGCGRTIPASSRFCAYCGRDLGAERKRER